MTNTIRLPRLLAVGAALAAGLLLSDAGSAQEPPPPYGAGWEQDAPQDVPQEAAQDIERRVERLTLALQLSAEQAAYVRHLLEEEHKQLQERRAEHEERETRRWWGADGGGARRPGPSPEARVLRQRTELQIERVLSDDQRARYRALREERADPGPPAPGTGG